MYAIFIQVHLNFITSLSSNWDLHSNLVRRLKGLDFVMVDREFTSLSEWLGPSVESSPLSKTTLLTVGELCLPPEVCQELGPEGLKLAIKSGLLGPVEAAQSVLSNSALFEQDSDPVEHSENAHFTNSVESASAAVESRPKPRQFSLTSVVVVALLICRFSFSLISVPHLLEFLVSYTLLLVISSKMCSSFQPQVATTTSSSSFLTTTRRTSVQQTGALNFCKMTISGFLLLSIMLFLLSVFQEDMVLDQGINDLFSNSWIVCICALLVLTLSYTESYKHRVAYHWLALTAIIFNGLKSSSSSSQGQGINDEFCFLHPITTLTLILALSISALMAEATKYKKSKSYS